MGTNVGRQVAMVWKLSPGCFYFFSEIEMGLSVIGEDRGFEESEGAK